MWTHSLLSLALTVGPPPVRRIANSDHLYAYGTNKLRRETTINGVRAVDLICWPFVKGISTCDSGEPLAHLFAGACGNHLSGELGAGSGCKRGDNCKKQHPPNVLESLLDWHAHAIGPPILGTVPIVAPQSSNSTELSRSAATAAGVATTPPPKCTVPPAVVRERLERHAGEGSPHVQRLLDTDFLDEMLAYGPTRRLLAQRGSVKEISEAFAAADEITRLATDGLGLTASDASAGVGLTILDVCSGKGVVGHLLSRLLPSARIIMLDACSELDLTHVVGRSNLEFVEVDLFTRDCAAVLHELSGGSSSSSGDASQQHVIAVGMHLCGALSPRMLALCAQLDRIDAYTVCPCCIKGSLGDHVKRLAKHDGRPNYDVLLETLRELSDRELSKEGGEDARVASVVRRDDAMVSPRNGFVSAVKRRQSLRSFRRVSIRMCAADDDDTLIVTDAGGRRPPRGVRHRARLMYDGAEFSGMQIQPNGKSVACAIEGALSKRMGVRIPVNAAGRTDAGVHARGQAFHFDLPVISSEEPQQKKPLPSPSELERSLNAMLPDAVRVINLELAPEVDESGRQWDARRWASGKLYSYRLHSGDVLDPLERRQRHHVGHNALDVPLMVEAAGHLHGLIDCAAFANRRPGELSPLECDPQLTTRLIRKVEVIDEGNGAIRVDFHVESALYKMVRNLVGLLIAVGQKSIAPSDVPGLIDARDRGRLPSPAPAHGLTLECVYYGVGWGGAHDHPLHRGGRESYE